jgi:hypothetical protein
MREGGEALALPRGGRQGCLAGAAGRCRPCAWCCDWGRPDLAACQLILFTARCCRRCSRGRLTHACWHVKGAWGATRAARLRWQQLGFNARCSKAEAELYLAAAGGAAGGRSRVRGGRRRSSSSAPERILRGAHRAEHPPVRVARARADGGADLGVGRAQEGVGVELLPQQAGHGGLALGVGWLCVGGRGGGTSGQQVTVEPARDSSRGLRHRPHLAALALP